MEELIAHSKILRINQDATFSEPMKRYVLLPTSLSIQVSHLHFNLSPPISSSLCLCAGTLMYTSTLSSTLAREN